MSLADALAALRGSAGSAGCIFINPPASTSAKARDQAARALGVLHRQARLPRLACLDRERLADAAVAADRAADAVAALAWSSTCDDDRVVLLAPAYDLARSAAAARLALAPADAALVDDLRRLAGDHAVALVAARRVAGC